MRTTPVTRLGHVASALVAIVALGACTEQAPSGGSAAAGEFLLEPCDIAQVAGDPDAPSPAAPRPGHFHFCGQLTVADAPVSVLVVANRADEPLRNRDVLVYHPGGPGVSPITLLREDPPEVDLSRYVVLAWDGATASSNRGTCGPVSTEYGTQRSTPPDAEVVGQLVDECLATVAPTGTTVATTELEAIRRAIAIPRFDLLTYSYGTAVAEAYLATFPDNVGRAVLDGPFGVDVAWSDRLEAVGRATNLAWEALAARCTQTCSDELASLLVDGYPALRTTLLARRPTVGAGQVELTGTVLDQAVLLALRDESFQAPLLDAITTALAGDGSALWRIGERYLIGVDRAVFSAAICADLVHPAQPEAYASSDPLVDTYASDLAVCSGVDRRDRRAGIGPTEAGNAEVLVIASTADVVTPAGLLDHAPDLTALGSVCTTGLVGHTGARHAAVGKIVGEFLYDGLLPRAGGVCQAVTKAVTKPAR